MAVRLLARMRGLQVRWLPEGQVNLTFRRGHKTINVTLTNDERVELVAELQEPPHVDLSEPWGDC